VIHQKVEPIPFDSDADLIAISTQSGFAPAAYRIAAEFKRRGKTVIGGGPHVTFCEDEAARVFDSIVIGEAEAVWQAMIADAEKGLLKARYVGGPCAMEGLPSPRYDLLPDAFFVKRVVQATRGCPFSCSFCSVPSLNPGFRMRPVADVMRDITYNHFKRWWQRKLVWFWDDNLLADRRYAKELLRAMIPHKKWWLTQASIDIARDEELLDLMQESGCIGIFLGIESFHQNALQQAHKQHNRIEEYRRCIALLHERGICVMAGFIAGFDSDTPASIVAMSDQLFDIGVDVPFLSILTPFKGTALHDTFEQEGRLIPQRGWEFYNGFNVAFTPANMDADELKEAHRQLWTKAFSLRHCVGRLLRSTHRLRLGAFLMTLCMNGFYGLKALRRNTPANMCDGIPSTTEATVPSDGTHPVGLMPSHV
ncbi:MAG: B12-binding domain-containing radical SAM protein, partial [Verrucomicrobia bacterium]|nr:B12-binding domain-containing radical SAM protein [Verrucomicrobiota bacterium]